MKKRLMALLLSLVMVFGLSVNAFAAEDEENSWTDFEIAENIAFEADSEWELDEYSDELDFYLTDDVCISIVDFGSFEDIFGDFDTETIAAAMEEAGMEIPEDLEEMDENELLDLYIDILMAFSFDAEAAEYEDLDMSSNFRINNLGGRSVSYTIEDEGYAIETVLWNRDHCIGVIYAEFIDSEESFIYDYYKVLLSFRETVDKKDEAEKTDSDDVETDDGEDAETEDGDDIETGDDGGAAVGVSVKDGAAFEPFVIADEEGIVITATAFDPEGYWGPELEITVENGSDTDIIVENGPVSVNGMMITPFFYVEAAAGETAAEVLEIDDYRMSICGIDEIGFFDFSLTVETDDYDEIFTTGIFEVTVDESVEQEFYTDGDLIYDDGGIQIICQGIDDDNFAFGESIRICVINESDETIWVSGEGTPEGVEDDSALFGIQLMPGSIAFDGMSFWETDVKDIEAADIWFNILEDYIFGDEIATTDVYTFTR